MTSYLRSIFSGQPAPGSDRQKTHNRSQSLPQNLSYVYGPPVGGTPSTTSSRPGSNHGHGYSTPQASPLRYATYNASSVSSQSHKGQSQRPTPAPRRASFKTSESAIPYPLYTPTVSFSSSRSTSSSSLHPVPLSTPPRSASNGNINIKYPARPGFKQSHTWHADTHSGPPHAHTSSTHVRPSLHMHPLLAHSRLHDAPISYDITCIPSSQSVLDRTTHTPVPAHTLQQPATDPPTSSSSRLVLRSDEFSWPVVVGQSGASNSSSASKGFYIAASSPSSKRSSVITNLDVLYALHCTLLTRVTREEWEALGDGSRSQRKVTRAYENRCKKMGGGWESGVRRVDWLGKKTRLIGVEVDKNVGMGKLIFGKA